MDCRLQVFRREDRVCSRTYRFAVIDFSRSKSYPANFICILPVKVDQGNGKSLNVFREMFGDKSLDLAKELLNDALKIEKDAEVIAEIERRLKLIDPKQVHLVKCGKCRKSFQPRRIRKYKQNFCDDCLKARYGLRQ
jgi:hypothetical protein